MVQLDPTLKRILDDFDSLSKSQPNVSLPSLDLTNVYKNLQTKPLSTKIDWSGYDGWEGKGKNKKKKKESKTDLSIDVFDLISGTIGQLGGITTDVAYNVINDIKEKDVPVWKKVKNVVDDLTFKTTAKRGLYAGAKEQLKAWKDGKLSWGDIPIVAFLHGMDKAWKRGSDIAKDHIGIKNKYGVAGAGLAIDIALDPLTYLTGGATTATKLAKVAEMAKLNEIAKGLGITKKVKSLDELKSIAEQALRAKHTNINPDLLNRYVTKKINDIEFSVKKAHDDAYNKYINTISLSIPFSNRATLPIKQLSENNILYRSEATLGDDYKHLVDDLLNNYVKNASEKERLIGRIKNLYGIDDISKMTKSMYDDLYERLSKVSPKKLPDTDVKTEVIRQDMPKETLDRLLKQTGALDEGNKEFQRQLNQILKQTKKDSRLRASFGADLAEMTSNYWKSKKGRKAAEYAKRGEIMSEVSNVLRNSDGVDIVKQTIDTLYKEGRPEKYVREVEKYLKGVYSGKINAKTRFEHWLDKKNPFDARTLKTDSEFINSMANVIADANSRIVGERAMYMKPLSDLQEFIKKNKVSESDMEQAIYLLEGKAPKRLLDKDGKFTPTKNAEKLAKMIKPILDEIGQSEKEAGVLTRMRDNYFPHVLKRGQTEKVLEEVFEEYKDILGYSQKNKFDKERKLFDTIADLEDAISTIAKNMENETDLAKLEKYTKDIEKLKNLFERNVLEVVQRRISESTRVKAMKEMQDEFRKYGMLKTNPKGSVGKDMVQLSEEEANLFGLGKGIHYIHKDVLEGMKHIDEVFTLKGLNKIQRHLSAFSDVWKPLVTYYNPVHYYNNIVGNIINNMAAGVNPSDYKKAFKLIRAYRSGKVTDEQMKLFKLAFKKNVLSGGFLYDSKPMYKFDNPTKLEKLSEKIIDNKPIKKVRSIGEYIDDVFRLANFINGLEKYKSTELASKQVREYLFNYNELTNADRFMKSTLIPFWNWMKRNVPLQLKILLENPKIPVNIQRFKDFFNEDQEGQEWQKDYGIKIPKTDYYLGVQSPTNDLEMLFNQRNVASSLHPLIASYFELLTNKKLYTGNPISYGEKDVQPEDLPRYIASKLGVVGKTYNTLTSDDPKEFLENLTKFFLPISKINNRKE